MSKEEFGDWIKCPVCKHVDYDSHELNQSGEVNCESCDIELFVEIHVSVEYTTTLVETEKENE